MDLKIELIKDHVSAIPTLARLWHETLGKLWEPTTSIHDIENWFNEWLNDDIPVAFVALVGDIPVGMCSLQLNDGVPSALMPWLGDLCVEPSYQHRGIGKKLIEAVEEKARAEGFKAIYLIAPDATIPHYYQRLNWVTIGMDNYKGHPVTLMQKELKTGE